MAKRALRTTLILAAALALATPATLRAQNAPPAASAVDPVYDSQKAAYDALSEADRRAIQDSLIWTGHYLGVVDGVFGKRTRDAIVAYQTSIKAPPNGLIDSAELNAMSGAAQKARAAVRFQIFTDERTGVKIGAPLKILDKRTASDSRGARLMKSDGSIALDLLSVAGTGANMSVFFTALVTDAPGKKVTLKINRPDFFVVSGEESGRKFYERMAKAPANSPDPSAVRGFRFSYPATQSADLDKIGVAIADSFEPFPALASSSATAPTASASPPPTPARPVLTATGLLVAPGQALSVIGAADCSNPTIDGKPAKFARDDRDAGLSLLSVEVGAGPPVRAPDFGVLGPDLVALSYASDEPGGRVTLNVTSASPLSSDQAKAHPVVVASLSKNASGAPVFDRKGSLVAMIAQSGGDPKLVAGVAPTAPYGVINADQIQRFLSVTSEPSTNSTAGVSLGAGQIAAAERGNVVAISCRR